jgi:hypothetical protein
MSPRGTTLTSPTGPVRHTRQHPPRHRHTRPMRASRAHNSGDTHNAIQYRAERDAHDRTHTGLTRRRSRQRAQRPANGRPEAPRARVHAREARSLVALDGGSDALDARRPAARLPAALAEQLVDREVPGLGGETQRAAPMPTALSGRRGRAAMGRTSRHRVADGGLVVRISTCHRVDLDAGLSGCVTESTRLANGGE